MILGNKVVLIDVYDNAYEIDVPSLDRRSRELLNIIWLLSPGAGSGVVVLICYSEVAIKRGRIGPRWRNYL